MPQSYEIKDNCENQENNDCLDESDEYFTDQYKQKNVNKETRNSLTTDRIKIANFNHENKGNNTQIDLRCHDRNVTASQSRPIVPTKPKLQVFIQNASSEFGVREGKSDQVEHSQREQSTGGRQATNTNQQFLQSEKPTRSNVKSLISRFNVA